jgi:hypothetical protein
MHRSRRLSVFTGATAFATTLAVAMSLAGVASAWGPRTLYVSAKGDDSGNCQRQSHACATISYALSQAAAGSRVLVGPGTYPESTPNVITPGLSGLSLEANRAVIDATGRPNGILDEANNTKVSGFTVENAQLEGILVEPPPSTWPATATASPANLTRVSIEGNVVEHNDAAYDTTAADPFNACPSSPTDSDDCGEGVHLLATTYSRVTGNRVVNNVGGILLSDGGLSPTSIGPAAHNVIAFNTSSNNAFDCGITLPGHDPRAVATTGSTAGQPQPSVAGVYDNLVEDNVATNNGGAGLLDATPYPGTAAYDNTFVGNFVAGNGEGGFQLHSHAPFQDVNDLRIVGNFFGTNNTAGDSDSGDSSTTGIILFSAVVPVTGIRVVGNVIAHNTFGIWRTANVTVSGLTNNLFFNNGTNVFTQ